MEVPISEIISVVIDPNSEYFGRTAEMIASDREFGDCYFRFDKDNDVQAIRLNDGFSTGLAQFIAFEKRDQEKADRLVAALPGIRDKISNLLSQVKETNAYPAAPETVRARLGLTALIGEATSPE